MNQDVIEILTIFGLILINGIFSMSEMALVSSKKVRLEAAVKNGAKGSKAALSLYNTPTYFLSTVQIGITLIGLLTGIFSGENITNELEAYLEQFELTRPFADGLAISIVLLSITFCSLVLGELIPKRLGLANPEGITRVVAPFMQILSKITFPFVWILTHTSDVILTILNLKKTSDSKITEEEIKAIIKEGTQGGEVQKIEHDIVERVFALGDRKISSLMTARSALIFLNADDDLSVMHNIIKDDLHRIYPVFEKDKDKILGIITLKDLYIGSRQESFNVRTHIKPAQYLDQNTSAYHALEQFKSSHIHYSLITNEYGLVLGIITMDDILKALVGDVSQFYREEFPLVEREDGTWLVDGQFPIAEFGLRFGIEKTPEFDKVNTVGGLVIHILHRIPKTSEKIKWNNIEIEVIDMDGVTVDKVLVKRK
jgi:putative hemolysin